MLYIWLIFYLSILSPFTPHTIYNTINTLMILFVSYTTYILKITLWVRNKLLYSAMSPTLYQSIKSRRTTITKYTFRIGKILGSLGRRSLPLSRGLRNFSISGFSNCLPCLREAAMKNFTLSTNQLSERIVSWLEMRKGFSVPQGPNNVSLLILIKNAKRYKVVLL